MLFLVIIDYFDQREMVDVMLECVKSCKGRGFENIRYLNIGGGLGIDYKKYVSRNTFTAYYGYRDHFIFAV